MTKLNPEQLHARSIKDTAFIAETCKAGVRLLMEGKHKESVPEFEKMLFHPTAALSHDKWAIAVYVIGYIGGEQGRERLLNEAKIPEVMLHRFLTASASLPSCSMHTIAECMRGVQAGYSAEIGDKGKGR